MTGADFAAAGRALARAYALVRPNGPAWLAAWQAGDALAADELSEWELEGHPFHPSTWSTPDIMTVTEVLDSMLALYATPSTWMRAGIAQDAAGRQVEPESSEAVAWSLEGALCRVVGDPELDGITESEWRQRIGLERAVSTACGVDLAAFGDIACHQDAVVAVLRAGRAQTT